MKKNVPYQLSEVQINRIRKAFGTQLRKYRNKTGLTQEEFAKIFGLTQPTIGAVEAGANIGIDRMELFASVFNVSYFELANPKNPIPELADMSEVVKKAAAESKIREDKQATTKRTKLATGESLYHIGTAKALHELVSAGFFKRSRTSKETYLKLHVDLSENSLTAEHRRSISSLTTTLSKGRFAKLLDKLAPLPGSTAVRFVEKTADKVDYTDGSGSAGIAADET